MVGIHMILSVHNDVKLNRVTPCDKPINIYGDCKGLVGG